MFERMLDKTREPNQEEIRAYLGTEGGKRLRTLEELLQARYELSRQLRFPFGSQYGWGYKYSHKSAHLCYAFFEKGAFTVTVQIGDRQVAALESRIGELTPKARELWRGRYPCGEQGGWVHDRVLEESDLADVLVLVQAKKPPRPNV